MWGEPVSPSGDSDVVSDFNSLAPCGANRSVENRPLNFDIFQLTRPVWGEPGNGKRSINVVRFQLTRPVWGEPVAAAAYETLRGISTHSPRVGRTFINLHRLIKFIEFQLTRPVWGEPKP